MKTYLNIYNVEDDNNELILKVEPLHLFNQSNQIISSNKDYEPTKGDKLYFLPGVNIPRVKLKDLSLQHGIKNVRDMDQATHVFIGMNTVNKITNSTWYFTLNTSALREILNDPELVMDDYYKENLKQALEFYTEEKVLVEYYAASNLRNSGSPLVNKYISKNISRHSKQFYTPVDEYKKLVLDITNLELYDERALLKHINGDDAATIDETMFNQISDMFESSDQDNHILAMEIMANCNYIDSLLYIEMLFNRYSGNMSNCRTKNHVNFKSLLSFLGKNKNYMYTDIDDIIKSLINKQVLDIDKIDIITKYYGSEIAHKGGTKYFEIKSLTLNEDIAKLINTNYVYETFPDYIPEIIEEKSEIIEESVNLNSLEDNTPNIVDDTNDFEISNEEILNGLIKIDDIEESEINSLEEDTNKNQIEKDDDDFEWF